MIERIRLVDFLLEETVLEKWFTHVMTTSASPTSSLEYCREIHLFIICRDYIHWVSIDLFIIIIMSYCDHGSPWNSLLPPPISLLHFSLEVLLDIPCIGTELFYIVSRLSSYLFPFMLTGPLEYIVHDFVLTSLTGSHMSGSCNFDSFRDEL